MRINKPTRAFNESKPTPLPNNSSEQGFNILLIGLIIVTI